MNFILADQDKEEIPFLLISEDENNENGFAHQQSILPGARAVLAAGLFGTMKFIEVACPEFSIWHSNYDMSRRTHIYCRMEEYVLELHFTLNNTLHFKMDGLSEVRLLPGQFNLSYAPYMDKITWFQKGEVYTNFGIHFTPAYLQQVASYFPMLDAFLQKVEKGIPGMLSAQHGQMTPEINTLVQKMLHCHFTGDVRVLYLQSKVLELLLLALEQVSTQNKSPDIQLRPYDIERIREAHDYLLQNMENPCTLIELSRKVGINDFKLKKGFKQLYGTTVYDFLLDARMEKARNLLLESDISVHDIALMMGYQTLSSFITAFKKKTGYSPGTFKKLRKGKP
jgi:AraC family transcriptional regulator, transcriptional activator of the genes for pyochelin and ferripyochelin receptors